MKVSNEFKVGALAIVCVAMLIIGYNILKGNAVFTSANTYYASYDAIEGLTMSNPVKIKGVQVGRVSNIYLGDRVTIKMSIDDDVKIPKKSIAQIVSADLLGSREVDIDVAAGKEYYKNGDTLLSGQQKSLTEDVQAEILPVKEKAENLLSSIDSVLTIVRTVFNPETQKNIIHSVNSITSTLNHVNSSAANMDELFEKNTTKLQAIFCNIESITTNLKKNEDNITAILSNFNQITDSIAKSNVRQTIGNAQAALEQASAILTKINKGEGSMGLLINDDKLYNNLQQSSKDLDLLLQDFKANPGRYVRLSLFGKKDKPAPTDGGQH